MSGVGERHNSHTSTGKSIIGSATISRSLVFQSTTVINHTSFRLDIGDGKTVDLDECPRSRLHQECISYLGPVSINQECIRARINDSLLYLCTIQICNFLISLCLFFETSKSDSAMNT